MKIGLIGPGRMGRPILDRLSAAGHEVTALVRGAEAQRSASAEDLSWAATAQDAVRGAEAVLVVVLNDAQVRSVCLGPDGALAAMEPGATLIQHTTSDPSTAALLADAGSRRSIGVLDAALSGGPADIAHGALTLWVGGDEALFASMRPLLETYASPVMFVGPLGNGQRVKLVNNALFVAQVGLVIDAVRLAGSLRINERAILGALPHGSAASRALDVVAAAGSVDDVRGRLADLMAKDVDVVRAVARSEGADLGILGTVLDSDAVEVMVLGRSDPPDEQR